MADLYDVNNVVVGKAVLWLAPWVLGSIEPPPADDQALFAEYPEPWIGAGGTDEGFKLTVDSSTQDITIEEQSTPAQRTIEAKTIAIEAALAEDTIASMQFAYGGNITTVAAGPAQPGKTRLQFSDDLKFWVGVLETANKFGLPRRYYVEKLVAGGSVETSFRRAAAARLYPVNFGSICAPSGIHIDEITAPATP